MCTSEKKCVYEREREKFIERGGKVSSKEKDADRREREREDDYQDERGTIVEPRQHHHLNEDLPYCHSKNYTRTQVTKWSPSMQTGDRQKLY